MSANEEARAALHERVRVFNEARECGTVVTMARTGPRFAVVSWPSHAVLDLRAVHTAGGLTDLRPPGVVTYYSTFDAALDEANRLTEQWGDEPYGELLFVQADYS